jgi:transposase-like protein
VGNLNLSRAETREIARRYQAGEGASGIGRSLGHASGKAVTRLLMDEGVFEPNRQYQGRYSPDQKARMVELYRAGATLASLSLEFGCTTGNIRVILRTKGVTTRPQGMATSPDEDRQIRALREAGLTVNRVAQELGISKHRALMRSRALGLSAKKMPRGPRNNLWRGGRVYRHGTGYMYVSMTLDDPMRAMAPVSGQVAEHRLVMARALGRPLARWETVHHINGDKIDNRLENLQLRNGHHGTGVVLMCRNCGSHDVVPAPIAEIEGEPSQ